jgi:hypothetical protein
MCGSREKYRIGEEEINRQAAKDGQNGETKLGAENSQRKALWRGVRRKARELRDDGAATEMRKWRRISARAYVAHAAAHEKKENKSGDASAL